MSSGSWVPGRSCVSCFPCPLILRSATAYCTFECILGVAWSTRSWLSEGVGVPECAGE